jgi:FkbM family methyltransferase
MAETPAATSLLSSSQIAAKKPEITLRLTPFDQRAYRKLIETRGAAIRPLVEKLKAELEWSTALDAGCGVGFFSQTLAECGLEVRGFDGREENVAEARQRFPGIRFERVDVEDRGVRTLGKFDLVLCCGLLYHLENPFLAIRNLEAVTKSCLLLESMCLPGRDAILALRNEPRQGDQSLTDVACVPSESMLVKMLYRAGFKVVYKVLPQPDHDDFRETAASKQRRVMLLASRTFIEKTGFELCVEEDESRDPWAKTAVAESSFGGRMQRFLRSPSRRKYITLANRLKRVFPEMPIPIRLQFGAWWLAENSALDQELLHNGFESAEMQVVERLLRPGMTVVDAGAHHGLYALLAAKRVGKKGKVVAAEPSPRECVRLKKHLEVNRAANVELVPCALGEETGETDLYLVDGFQDWCNSLRPPAISDSVKTARVRVRTLDDLLDELRVLQVDFLKLDVEGAELSVLYGAMKLLRSEHRSAILAEVQDIRTKPWGYAAREIIGVLKRMDYQWYAIGIDGGVTPANTEQKEYDANFLALPQERETEFLEYLQVEIEKLQERSKSEEIS